MIKGAVSVDHEIVVKVPVHDKSGQAHETWAVLDTGFSGSVTLPQSLIESLGLRWSTQGDAVLADGSLQQFDIYTATITWDGVSRDVLVYEADMIPLVGMTLLVGFDLRARVIPAGKVEIEAIPRPLEETRGDIGS